MRIVMLTTNLAIGGAEAQVARLSARLRERRWDVSVVSLIAPSAFARELASAGVPVCSLDLRPGGMRPAALLRLAAILRQRRPHILHTHLFHANVLGRITRLAFPLPVVVSTLHSVAESGRDSADVSRRDRMYRLTDRLADMTVAVSPSVRERHCRAKAASAAKLRVIPNGIDTGRFRPDPETRAAARRQLGIADEFAWIAAGRLLWKKDYPTMLRAFAAGGGGVLLIAGAGPQRQELEALALETGANVRFLGEWSTMPDLMNACDGFVLSSVVEGLPMVLLEASACGLPCVATDVGGVAEIVLNARTGFVVPPQDPAQLASAMRRLMAMPASARDEMGRAARTHVVQHFDQHAVTSQWESLYRELVEQARLAMREDGA
jgi:glycosyltransferase involved in cell wall biosynthesis